jgi:dTDP-4-dehydrorhamnose reductase
MMIVINATAYTAVDKAEKEHQAADRINHLAVASIASICNQRDCRLIHLSTDYVFDGNSEVPYKEDNPTNPQGVYGDSTLKGAVAINVSRNHPA